MSNIDEFLKESENKAAVVRKAGESPKGIFLYLDEKGYPGIITFGTTYDEAAYLYFYGIKTYVEDL